MYTDYSSGSMNLQVSGLDNERIFPLCLFMTAADENADRCESRELQESKDYLNSLL